MQNFYSIILLHYRQVELFFPLTEFKYYKIIYMVLSGYWWAAVYFVYSTNLAGQQQVAGLALIGQSTLSIMCSIHKERCRCSPADFFGYGEANISAMLESSSHPPSPAAPHYLFNAVVANFNMYFFCPSLITLGLFTETSLRPS